jgi:hypothetical protein
MPLIHARPAGGLLALAATALVAAASPADAAPREQRLVVRGDASVVDGPCDARACRFELTDGRFRSTLGTGTYSGSFKVKIADAFPNGEGASCAPLRGRIVLRPDDGGRLVITVSGDSCQDGAGSLDAASFTGLARFTVKRGGYGQAVLTEDAANRHRMTLVGRS